MGRGRAKAKQTKVARELKYRDEKTDFASLQRELSAAERDAASATAVHVEPDGPDDVYSAYVDDQAASTDDDPSGRRAAS